jgi:hypothetical protein
MKLEADDVKVMTDYRPFEGKYFAGVSIKDVALVLGHRDIILTAIVNKIAEEIARQYIAKHGQEIIARIDPQAMANLCVANGAAKINETLAKKLPDVVREIVREVPTFINVGHWSNKEEFHG